MRQSEHVEKILEPEEDPIDQISTEQQILHWKNLASYVAAHQETVYYHGPRGALCIGTYAARGALQTAIAYTLQRSNGTCRQVGTWVPGTIYETQIEGECAVI